MKAKKLLLLVAILQVLFSAKTNSQCITGASAIIYGQPCGEPDWNNLSNAGQLGGLTVNTSYKYFVSYGGLIHMNFQHLTLYGTDINPGVLFNYTGPTSVHMLVNFPCSPYYCGGSGTVTLTFKQGNTTVCTKTYTFQEPSTSLTASPSSPVCSNVPITVTFHSTAGPTPSCVYAVYNSNPSEWRINGLPGSMVCVYNTYSAVITNVSGTTSSTTITFGDCSLCYCCPYVCSTPSITLSCIPAPVANAGVDKTINPCCGTTIGTPALPNTTYSWSPTTRLSCTTCAQPFTDQANITYTVTTTSTLNGCTATDQVHINAGNGPACGCTRMQGGSVENAQPYSLVELVPNPSASTFNLQLNPEAEIRSITAFDAMGRRKLELISPVAGENYEVGKEWSPGIYLIKISTAEGEKVIKAIKTK